jgi:uracil-DNA glycosylase
LAIPTRAIVVVGLAPAAHGANRTGRMFTGDGTGGSGDFLMAAMHANGLANQPYSRSADDGLALVGTWMLAAVRCAPPDNRPDPARSQIVTCTCAPKHARSGTPASTSRSDASRSTRA